jgi:hypothetical protein
VVEKKEWADCPFCLGYQTGNGCPLCGGDGCLFLDPEKKIATFDVVKKIPTDLYSFDCQHCNGQKAVVRGGMPVSCKSCGGRGFFLIKSVPTGHGNLRRNRHDW